MRNPVNNNYQNYLRFSPFSLRIVQRTPEKRPYNSLIRQYCYPGHNRARRTTTGQVVEGHVVPPVLPAVPVCPFYIA